MNLREICILVVFPSHCIYLWGLSGSLLHVLFLNDFIPPFPHGGGTQHRFKLMLTSSPDTDNPAPPVMKSFLHIRDRLETCCHLWKQHLSSAITRAVWPGPKWFPSALKRSIWMATSAGWSKGELKAEPIWVRKVCLSQKGTWNRLKFPYGVIPRCISGHLNGLSNRRSCTEV